MIEAMGLLGQTDMNDLRCVYCDSAAETWDHLVGLVKNSQLRGYGHQIGNLVPSCSACNSSKGNKDWRAFLRSRITDLIELKRVEQMLGTYLRMYAKAVKLGRMQTKNPKQWHKYDEIRLQIIEPMEEADKLTAQLRTDVID